MSLEITSIGKDIFKVKVSAVATTTHEVSVLDADLKSLTGGKISKEALLKFSFEFLLEREPNTAILPSFNIRVIAKYFSEYEKMLSKHCCLKP